MTKNKNEIQELKDFHAQYKYKEGYKPELPEIITKKEANK